MRVWLDACGLLRLVCGACLRESGDWGGRAHVCSTMCTSFHFVSRRTHHTVKITYALLHVRLAVKLRAYWDPLHYTTVGSNAAYQGTLSPNVCFRRPPQHGGSCDVSGGYTMSADILLVTTGHV